MTAKPRLSTSRHIWLIWERVHCLNGQKRFLRAVDTNLANKDAHLIALGTEPGHGEFEVEEQLSNHLMGHSMATVMGEVLNRRQDLI